MRTNLIAAATILGALSAPLAAQAQVTFTPGVTTGVVGGNTVIVDEDGIAVDQRPQFREYIVRERIPSYNWGERVVVGATLPDEGVNYYNVPERYGPATSRYRYTVVNDRPVIVEPRTRRVIQVID